MDLNKTINVVLAIIAIVMLARERITNHQLNKYKTQTEACLNSLSVLEEQSVALKNKITVAESKNKLRSKESSARHEKLIAYKDSGCVKTAKWAKSHANDFNKAFSN